MSLPTIERLQRWFLAQCDGEWEHDAGIAITNYDNPGWRVEIQLEGTALEDVPFEEYEAEYDHETAWLRCWKEGTSFRAACGPERLDDALRRFLDWAETPSAG